MVHLDHPSFVSVCVRRGSENLNLLSFAFFIPNFRACPVTPTSQATYSCVWCRSRTAAPKLFENNPGSDERASGLLLQSPSKEVVSEFVDK
jgi:hypothetical protein